MSLLDRFEETNVIGSMHIDVSTVAARYNDFIFRTTGAYASGSLRHNILIKFEWIINVVDPNSPLLEAGIIRYCHQLFVWHFDYLVDAAVIFSNCSEHFKI